MTSSYSPEDFKRPSGNITQDMFPEEDLDVLIAPWIEKGEDLSVTLTDQEKFDWAVWNYVYWQAYLSLFIDLSQQPSTVGFQDQANESWSLGQIRNFADLAVKHEKAFLAAVAESSNVLELAPKSRSVVNNYNW